MTYYVFDSTGAPFADRDRRLFRQRGLRVSIAVLVTAALFCLGWLVL